MKILNVLQTLGRYALELLGVLFVIAVLAFLVLAMVAPANAAGTTANVSWTLPATYIDDSALPASDILETVVEWRRTAGGPVVGTVRVATPATSTAVPGLACGDFVFTAWVVTKASAKYPSATGQAYTPPVAYATGVACVPKAPSLTVS